MRIIDMIGNYFKKQEDQQFKYKDKVKVVSGFFEGESGTIYHKSTVFGTRRYIVSDTGYFCEFIDASDLELLNK